MKFKIKPNVYSIEKQRIRIQSAACVLVGAIAAVLVLLAVCR